MPRLKSPLAYRRESLGLTQHELARIAKVERGTIAPIELGYRVPAMESFERLRNALQLTAPEMYRLVHRTKRWRSRVDALKEPLRVA